MDDLLTASAIDLSDANDLTFGISQLIKDHLSSECRGFTVTRSGCSSHLTVATLHTKSQYIKLASSEIS
ncbi:hypothetical protein Agabi119p4_5402 [Agaricus bisporus var. burnettii]|uniref:Uncharacterized protein n=1 Tax=Agaricus bisporus var. burnettii TaxID=192524 RepID=A0A8H7F1J9_AGABI|nr:hypothetical protein Agabi119p4_5402 [Agaricus bisporus var. burnettii]